MVKTAFTVPFPVEMFTQQLFFPRFFPADQV